VCLRAGVLLVLVRLRFAALAVATVAAAATSTVLLLPPPLCCSIAGLTVGLTGA
jgi:hypothetical protein